MAPEKTDEELIDFVRRSSPTMQPMPTEEQARPPDLKNVKTVLFDVYGTLLISGIGDIGMTAKKNQGKAMREALMQCGVAADDGLVDRAVGFYHEAIVTAHEQSAAEYPEVDIVKIWEAVLAKLNLEVDLRFLALVFEMRVNPTCAMPGAKEALHRLKEKGLQLGIVSNAQFYTPLVLEAHFGASLEAMGFTRELCRWSCKQLEAKPSPSLFPVGSDQTLFIGNDMLKDIWAAQQVGCQTALFAGDQRSLRKREDDKRCRGLKADYVITDWPDSFT